MPMTLIYLALGTNLGDRLENLHQAVLALAPPVRVLRLSPLYQTAPWGYRDQPDFLNQAVEAETELEPQALLEHLKEIERRMGRQKTIRYGPRSIDLDILFYGQQVIDLPGLVIPHPRLHERAFVLAPLADLAPAFVHPLLRQTVSQLLAAVNLSGVRLYRAEEN